MKKEENMWVIRHQTVDWKRGIISIELLVSIDRNKLMEEIQKNSDTPEVNLQR